MNARRSSSAEDTTAFLQGGEHSGSPVMIPGAFEKRARAAAAPLTGTHLTDHANGVAISDRERLVYEREGGGAPSERSGRPATMFRRLWRTMRRQA